MATDSGELRQPGLPEHHPSVHEDLGGGIGMSFPARTYHSPSMRKAMEAADPTELEPAPQPGWELDLGSDLPAITQIIKKFESTPPWRSPQDVARQIPPGPPQAA